MSNPSRLCTCQSTAGFHNFFCRRALAAEQRKLGAPASGVWWLGKADDLQTPKDAK